MRGRTTKLVLALFAAGALSFLAGLIFMETVGAIPCEGEGLACNIDAAVGGSGAAAAGGLAMAAPPALTVIVQWLIFRIAVQPMTSAGSIPSGVTLPRSNMSENDTIPFPTE